MRLIDADEAQERFRETYCKNCNNYNGIKCRACELKDGADIYDDMQEVDAVTVVHGHWVSIKPDENGYAFEYVCSVCKKNVFLDYYDTDCEYMFCPHCGACMDELKDGDNDAP